jgi:hypothetical protein
MTDDGLSGGRTLSKSGRSTMAEYRGSGLVQYMFYDTEFIATRISAGSRARPFRVKIHRAAPRARRGISASTHREQVRKPSRSELGKVVHEEDAIMGAPRPCPGRAPMSSPTTSRPYSGNDAGVERRACGQLALLSAPEIDAIIKTYRRLSRRLGRLDRGSHAGNDLRRGAVRPSAGGTHPSPIGTRHSRKRRRLFRRAGRPTGAWNHRSADIGVV